ncbi:hypothetical protein ACVEU9_002372 [Klebsiella aerogenes]
MSKILTDEELNALIEKAQAHLEVMSELGTKQEAEESGQILSALCELKRCRERAAPGMMWIPQPTAERKDLRHKFVSHLKL